MANLVGRQLNWSAALVPFALDGVIVIVFVAIGRGAHRHGVTTSGMASTLWPFAIGLAAGWLGAIKLHLRPRAQAAAVVIVSVTVAIGMALRVISGQGTAFAFILVALGFLGALMIGWRLLYQMAERRYLNGRAPKS